MLRIRLSRTGRKNYPSYRIVVAEHSAPIKGKFIEIVGHYIPSRDPKVLEYDADKIREWIKKGAKPTDTVASLLKRDGVSDMDPYIDERNKQRKKKKEDDEEEAPTAAPALEADAPAEEKAEKPAEEPPADEKKAEDTKTPAEAPAPKADAPVDKKPAEEEKKEQTKAPANETSEASDDKADA